MYTENRYTKIRDKIQKNIYSNNLFLVALRAIPFISLF